MFPRAFVTRGRRAILGIVVLSSAVAFAEDEVAPAVAAPASDAPADEKYVGQVLDEVRVRFVGALWQEPVLLGIRAGDVYDPEVALFEAERLSETGFYAEIAVELVDESGRRALVFVLTPRRLVSDVRFVDAPPLATEARATLGFARDDELTERSLDEGRLRLVEFYRKRGYPDATISLTTGDTDDAKTVVVSVQVEVGDPERLVTRRVLTRPSPPDENVSAVLAQLPPVFGLVADEKRLRDEAEDVRARLRAARYFEAEVTERLLPRGVVELRVDSGPRFSLRIDGTHAFGASEIEELLALPTREQIRPEILEPAILDFYRRRGFFDAKVRVARVLSGDRRDVAVTVTVREGAQLLLARRSYPCLDDDLPIDVDAEVDGVLGEELVTPGLLTTPAAGTTDAALDQRSSPRRDQPFLPRPYEAFSTLAYEAARKHIEDLLVAEGYFVAKVAPPVLLRARCERGTRNENCVEGPLSEVELTCSADGIAKMTAPEACVSAPERGVFCSEKGEISTPIVAGPRAVLYDVVFQGNEEFPTPMLARLSDLRLGEPARRADLEQARTALVSHYAEQGYAFAEVEANYEVSDDATRARAVFRIAERERVTISAVRIVGAERTRLSLVESRLSLAAGDLYRKSSVEASQRQLESLGVFSSVSIGLLDPSVYAREKVVVVTVTERTPQYLDLRGGLSTGEGVRVGLEYGHRNLGGEAIGLTLGVQLGMRPPFMLVEPDVREKYEDLVRTRGLGELLERRNSLLVGFPETGLGPLFRFEAEGLDVRSNQRDFGLEKDALILRLLFRPARTLWFQLGGSVERNSARIFGAEENKDALDDYVSQNTQFAGLIRVPEGVSIAFTQNLEVNWDRRDRPLSAHRGTLVSFGVEHVTAIPVERRDTSCSANQDSVFGATCSELLRYTGRAAVYVPLYRGSLRRKGLVLAMSVRGGVIQHLSATSRTYPDRLFFVGGVDTLRGYQQWSLVPQEYAEELTDPNSGLAINQVVLRGGDLFVNPRAELRVPLGGSLETVLFLDAANLWLDPGNLNFAQLRPTVGSGLRVDTPVGPLVFDYGFNVTRLVDSLLSRTSGTRFWESEGEFHFSIGLF